MQTDSKYWGTVKLIGNPFLVKKTGVCLSSAIGDLLKGSANTAFECATAQSLYFWMILSQFPEIEEAIAKLEQRDKGFFLPLTGVPTLLTLRDYANLNNFFGPNRAICLENETINTKEEWKKLNQFDNCLKKLSSYFGCVKRYLPEHKFPPFETVAGGSFYLPNVAGVTGEGKGENLVCVDKVMGLYYGFGNLFKDGPKTLNQVGEDLKKFADKHHPGLYDKALEDCLKNVDKVEDGHHALEYLVEPRACCYFDITRIEACIKAAKGNLCQSCGKPARLHCSACGLVFYCGTSCQKVDWEAHKTQCKKRKT